jgi:DNA mismatch repair protein MutS
MEHEDNIIFMHAIQEGAASKSFGLQVAQLAGVPKMVISRAKQRLLELENQKAPSILSEQPECFQQLSLVADDHPALDALRNIDVNDLSPKQALDLLFELKATV